MRVGRIHNIKIGWLSLTLTFILVFASTFPVRCKNRSGRASIFRWTFSTEFSSPPFRTPNKSRMTGFPASHCASSLSVVCFLGVAHWAGLGWGLVGVWNFVSLNRLHLLRSCVYALPGLGVDRSHGFGLNAREVFRAALQLLPSRLLESKVWLLKLFSATRNTQECNYCWKRIKSQGLSEILPATSDLSSWSKFDQIDSISCRDSLMSSSNALKKITKKLLAKKWSATINKLSSYFPLWSLK